MNHSSRILWVAFASVFLGCGGGAETTLKFETTKLAVTQPPNYLRNTLDEAKIAAFFAIPVGGVVTKQKVVELLVRAGVPASDAVLIQDWKFSIDAPHANSLDAELRTYSRAYFGTPGLTSQQINTIVSGQGGYTTKQYLAYLRVGFGEGRCNQQRVGTGSCLVSVLNLQTVLHKSADFIWNLRYLDPIDNKWKNTFSLHREDIAYRLIFDEIARRFGGHTHNPLRDIVLDVSDPSSPACQLLTSTFENGAAFEATLNQIPGMPLSLAHSGGGQINGVSEQSINVATGIMGTYRYGLFYFMQGENCSRLEAANTCFVGEPALADFLFVENSIPRPRDDGQFTWTCEQVAKIIDVIVSNPYENPYDVIRPPTNYQFNAETYPLRNAPTNLTAEDVLLFFVGLSNGHANALDGDFIDNSPQSDIQAMQAENVLNPEYVFQYLTIPAVFDQFLD